MAENTNWNRILKAIINEWRPKKVEYQIPFEEIFFDRHVVPCKRFCWVRKIVGENFPFSYMDQRVYK